MGELISKLGIDWKLLLAQAINFGILVIVLTKFAYKPLMKVLDERAAKVKKSLDDAKRVEENLKAAETQKQEKIVEARKTAKEIVDLAAKDAEAVRQEKLANTKAEVERLVAQAKQQIGQERDKAMNEASRELADLVALATSRVVKEKLDAAADRKLIEEALKSLKR